MEAALFIGEPAWDRHHQRLAVCMAASALALLLLIVVPDWPPLFDLRRLLPLELELTVRPAPEEHAPPRVVELPPPVRPAPLPETDATPLPLPQVVTPAAQAEPRAPAAERPAAGEPERVTTEAPVDWYAELERAAAEVGARAAAEPRSMHPEFDELRRIAKLRYGKPRTNPPARGFEVVKDPYGRTLLQRGNTYQVLEDRRLFNQYAFETFERHMIFVSIPLGRQPPKNLPWVEVIRARYDYMREPDELPPLKAAPAEAVPTHRMLRNQQPK